jgi:hypothetical protein
VIPPALRSVLPAILAVAAVRPAEWQTPAELLLTNANIITLEPALPRASALAVRDGRVQALGSAESLARLRGPQTEIFDAQGRTVLPGFVDSHLHLVEYGRARSLPALEGRTLAEIEALVRSHPPTSGGFVRLWGWGAYLPEGRQYPTNELLDRWAPERPVVLERGDGHVALYSTAALRALDLEKLERERGFPSSYIERDPTGRPTGILMEEANWAAASELDRRETESERRRAVEITLERLRELGITSVQNILFSPVVLPLYQRMLEEGTLTVRLDAAIMGRVSRGEKERLLKLLKPGTDPLRLRINAAKYFADGALGPGTAALFEPYSYDPARRGILMWKNGEELAAYLEDDLALGLQSMVHAMGDRGIRTALDAFEILQRRQGPADYRFRIEHGNMPTPYDLERWRNLGVVWSYQPPAWTEEYRARRKRTLGEARLEYSENAQAFLDQGMVVAVGSDAPFYVDLNPLVNVESLSARHAHNTAYPRHLPVFRALEMVTRGSAFAAREESSRGSLAPGKLADFVVLSADPLRVPAEEIGEIRVERTVIGGRTVWGK